MVADSTLSVLKTRVQCRPRSVVLYSPPMSLPLPPYPLRTPAHQVFWVASSGSIVTSFVQYCMPGEPAAPISVRSAHVAPPSLLRNTPELAVKLVAPFTVARRAEKLARISPLFSTRMLNGWPSVRGGLASFVHVLAAPRFALAVV